MIKQISRLEHKIGDRVYHLLVESDSPLSEVKECLFQFLAYCAKIEDAAKAQQEQKEEKPIVEEVPVEEEVKAEEASIEAS